jgi:two-component system LytT family sensor kinase
MKILSKQPLLQDKPILIHIICWAAFIFIEVVVAGLVRQRFNSVPFYIMFCSINIGLFYLHGDFVMRFAKRDKLRSWSVFLMLCIGEIGIYCVAAMLTNFILLHVFDEQPENGLQFDEAYFAVVIYRGLFFITFGTGYYFLKQFLKRRVAELGHTIEVGKLQNQLLIAHNDYLRAQINPHLLFNTLDFIKAVSKKNPDQSDEAIDCLSDIMDYALRSSNRSVVLVVEEIEQMQHVIRLNLLRSNNRLNLNFIKKIENKNAEIIPIVLLTLVENVFKHGNLLDNNSPASFELFTSNKLIKFTTCNLIARTLPKKNEVTGLKNITDRLEQYYQGRHAFSFETRENMFYTELTINQT